MYNYVMFEGDEIFKPILNKNGTKSIYEISNFGTIYNIQDKKFVKPVIEKYWNQSTNQWNRRKVAPENKWRAIISLTFDDWKYKGTVARLMLMTFNPLDDYSGMECDHINEDPRDDRLSNLQWISSVNNKIKSAKNRNRSYTDYSDDTVRLVIEMILAGKTRSEIASTLQINPRLVNDIKSGRSHRKISSEYIDRGFNIVRQNSDEMTKRQLLVKQICEMIDNGMSNSDIRLALNLNNNDTCLPNDIRKLRVYRHISKDYNFYKESNDIKKEMKYNKKIFI